MAAEARKEAQQRVSPQAHGGTPTVEEQRKQAEAGHAIAKRLARDLPPGPGRDQALKALDSFEKARERLSPRREDQPGADAPKQERQALLARKPEQDRDRD